MLFLVDPNKPVKEVCILLNLCLTKCKDVAYPLYGLPPD